MGKSLKEIVCTRFQTSRDFKKLPEISKDYQRLSKISKSSKILPKLPAIFNFEYIN